MFIIYLAFPFSGVEISSGGGNPQAAVTQIG
jgi:hypothetical protein